MTPITLPYSILDHDESEFYTWLIPYQLYAWMCIVFIILIND